MRANQTVFPVQKGRSTQTGNIILLNAEDVEFVMENKVSNRKRPIVILHVELFMIQFEIGNYFGAMLAHKKGQHGAVWGEAGTGTELMTGLDIYGSTLGNSPRHRRLTRYELCRWGSSAPIKSAEKIFSTLIYAGVMALVHV